MKELMERVQREDREWREACLHFNRHGSWDKGDCAVCVALYPESPYLNLTPWARDHLAVEDFRAIADRAERMNARVGAFYSTRHHRWMTSADNGTKRVQLRGSGPLVAVLMAVLDDLDEAMVETRWTEAELLAIAAQSGIEVRRA